MSNGRVITSYFIYAILIALIPGLWTQHWLGFAIGAGIVIIWWVIAAVMGDRILLKSMRAEPLNVVIYSEIGKIVTAKRLGHKFGIPSLWVISDVAPMIMSVGLSPRASHLVFSKGFLDRLDDKAQLSMVVRELESIRAGRTSANTAASTLLWFIMLPGRLVNMITGRPPGEPNTLSTVVNLIPAFVAGLFVLLTADRPAMYAVDRAAQKQLDNPDYVPYALMKLQDAALGTPFNCELALTPCCVMNPNSRDPYAALFKPHPTTPKRIERLRPRTGKRR